MSPYYTFSLPSLQLWHLQSKANSIRNLPMRILMVILVILCCLLIAIEDIPQSFRSPQRRVQRRPNFHSFDVAPAA